MLLFTKAADVICFGLERNTQLHGLVYLNPYAHAYAWETWLDCYS